MSTDLTRRTLLCVAAGCAAAAAGGCGDITHTAFFRKNFRDYTKAEVDQLIADLERETSAAYGKEVTVGAEPPLPDVKFGYALDSRIAPSTQVVA